MPNIPIKVGIIDAGNNTRKMHLPKLQAIPGVLALRGNEEIKLTPFVTGVEYMKFTEAVILSVQRSSSRIYL